MIQDKQIFTSILGFLAIENSVYDKQKNLFFAIFKIIFILLSNRMYVFRRLYHTIASEKPTNVISFLDF